jgi:K+-transporting ATPase ATPase C chain
MKKTFNLLKISALATLTFTFILCVVYPLLVFAVGQILFPHQANGSLVTRKIDYTIIGSELIGENFQAAGYFHPRPSAAGKTGYDASSSSGSNLGPTSQKLITAIQTYAATYRNTNSVPEETLLPVDAVTSSGSGLDPHISVENALLQIPRVAKARNISEALLKNLVKKHTEKPTFGFLGEARVNVLLLNVALDERNLGRNTLSAVLEPLF